MYKYNFYIGMFDKDLHRQVIPEFEFLNRIKKVLDNNLINCFTLTSGTGHYKSSNMDVIEPTIIIEYITPYSIDTDKLRNEFKYVLNQEDILIIRQDIEIL